MLEIHGSRFSQLQKKKRKLIKKYRKHYWKDQEIWRGSPVSANTDSENAAFANEGVILSSQSPKLPKMH